MNPSSQSELISIDQLGSPPRVEKLWALMDIAWRLYGCSQWRFNSQKYKLFYSHPVWKLNGIFIEQDPESKLHREIFAQAISIKNPKNILDYGGGSGFLAELIATKTPGACVELYDPYMTATNGQLINRICNLKLNTYDLILATDVLEHVHDPLKSLEELSHLLVDGGWLLLANCFEPVVLCHLPKTFYLKFSLPIFAKAFGLKFEGCVDSTHAIWLRKVRAKSPFWPLLRVQEKYYQFIYPVQLFWYKWGAAIKRRMPF